MGWGGVSMTVSWASRVCGLPSLGSGAPRRLRAVKPGRRLSERKRGAARARCNRVMPWTTERYPVSMRHLPDAVRSKAIEIANALLDEGVDEGKAIRIAIAKARQWAQRHSAAHVWGIDGDER